MANRNVTQSGIRKVTNVVADLSSASILDAVGALGGFAEAALERSQRAKMTEGLTQATMELNALSNQYQIDNESNPAANIKQFQKDRQKIFDNLGKGISPLYKQQWVEKTGQLKNRSDLTMQAWEIKQAQENTVNSINKTIKANLGIAVQEGQRFGLGEIEEFEPVLNFQASREELEDFAEGRIGDETMQPVLDNYKEDRVKSFLSGVADTNPLKALALMEDEQIQNAFSDQDQFLDMKKAIKNKALRLDDIAQENEILDILRDESNLLTRSLQENVSYAELQQIFSEQKISENAQNFFLKVNGYKRPTKTDLKLTNSEKMKVVSDLYRNIAQVSAQDEITTGDIQGLQAQLVNALDQGAITAQKGAGWMAQILAPAAEKRKENLEKFQETFTRSVPFVDRAGFSDIETYFEDHVQVDKDVSEADRSEVSNNINNANRIKLYDFYLDALQQEATALNMEDVSQIVDLPDGKQRDVLNRAVEAAKRSFASDVIPSLASIPEEQRPHAVLRPDGNMITDIQTESKAVVDEAVKPEFKTMRGADGRLYNIFPDGSWKVVE